MIIKFEVYNDFIYLDVSNEAGAQTTTKTL